MYGIRVQAGLVIPAGGIVTHQRKKWHKKKKGSEVTATVNSN